MVSPSSFPWFRRSGNPLFLSCSSPARETILFSALDQCVPLRRTRIHGTGGRSQPYSGFGRHPAPQDATEKLHIYPVHDRQRGDQHATPCTDKASATPLREFCAT